MTCSQKRRCQMPRSPFCKRRVESLSLWGIWAANRALISIRDLCQSPSSVILNGAKRSEESRICWRLRDSSVAPLPQNDKVGHFRRGLNSQSKVYFPVGADPCVRPFGAQPWGTRSGRTHGCAPTGSVPDNPGSGSLRLPVGGRG